MCNIERAGRIESTEVNERAVALESTDILERPGPLKAGPFLCP